ncbi:hypothetical protein C2S53_016160 [Perilla frutescens var. hirtella]|uniref:Peptidase A1 domain-containing protein n=1 Tax=Perilla frutescens var. hirtella TaxID=608512 RepID=A0AAD4J4L0_PERFH|nr:hypothetical protein C2S53_016160 [Perilla frutescens var. hirtella]
MVSISGFTTDLIHRDSPHSPSYDPSLSPSQRIINALKRSSHRAQRLINLQQKRSKLEPEPDLSSAQGEYLMKYSVGTPPVPSIAIADTGSDVVWTQCSPCIECFNQTLPFFSPRNSSSFRRIPCTSPICNSTRDTHCSGVRQNCLYSGLYGDGSYTTGMLATESFTFASTGRRRTVTIPDVVFGCGFKNGGLFSGIESGIVGLGGGKNSLVTQLGPLAGGKFSYCLVPFLDNFNSSKLHFGAEAEVSGGGAVSTPLFVRNGMETFYFVTLEGISVGNLTRLEFYDDSFSHLGSDRQGNTIIDSGTTLTLLPSILYAKLEKAIKSLIKLEQVKDPSGVLELCYAARGAGIPDFPQITVHFRGADLKWTFENAFVRMSEDTVCLAAKATADIAIYGNLAQVNFLVGYDVANRTLSFKPFDCGRY